ncbi:unnamed protein product [Pleuronectes platessa]|uniref:Uncharacterized protein n=1 Tax=Pleuronectes platessa TaxID=8262 RepID=A0A9N7YX14_PLEPL|nr:unnamed protein product [Pleuronectes platessa]
MAAAKEQVVMAVVRAVSWCMRWCGEVRSRGSQADALSAVPARACGFLRFSQRERTQRGHQEESHIEQGDSIITTECRLKGAVV